MRLQPLVRTLAFLTVALLQTRLALARRAHYGASVGLSNALECLRQTTPSLDLEYPEDADSHVRQIRDAMRPWNKGWVGLLHVEDIWMTHFLERFENRSQGSRLSDVFGPYVPIFTRWVNPWKHNRGRYPKGFVKAFLGVLRPKVPYVAVSQNDRGIVAISEFRLADHPNILVLSGGGYGHVPVPLLDLRGVKNDVESTAVEQGKRRPIAQRKYFVSYVGMVLHAPRKMRQRMKASVEHFAAVNNMTDKVSFYYARDETWRDVMVDSKVSLAPRGFGRTSFHLWETVRAGLVPVHVYTDMPWVPYPHLYEKFGFQSTLPKLPSLLEQLKHMPNDELKQREALSAQFARTHFTISGIADQIQRFLSSDSSDLVCQPLPASIRDE